MKGLSQSRYLGISGGCVCLILLVLSAQPAAADTSEVSADEILEALTHLEQTGFEGLVDPAADAQVTTLGPSYEVEENQIDIPFYPEDVISFVAYDGQSISFSLPSVEGAEPAHTLPDGVVSYPSSSGSANAVISSSGAIQALTFIDSFDARDDYGYDFQLPPGVYFEIGEHGQVNAVTLDGDVLFFIAPPWAIDAAGQEIPTWYELSGETITQVIAHSSVSDVVYPVVADPWLNFDAIESWEWTQSEKGWTISVRVTPWNYFVDSWSSWGELLEKVDKDNHHMALILDTRGMYDQWTCHALGQEAMWFAMITGKDKRPTWDLESWRPPARDFFHMAKTLCNW